MHRKHAVARKGLSAVKGEVALLADHIFSQRTRIECVESLLEDVQQEINNLRVTVWGLQEQLRFILSERGKAEQ